MNTEIQNILLIMNCTKYRDKALHQKKTWLSTLDEKISSLLSCYWGSIIKQRVLI